jgi:hypothetical protein
MASSREHGYDLSRSETDRKFLGQMEICELLKGTAPWR